MGWDGAGSYTRNFNFSADASSGIKILAARMDAELDDFASAMTIALTRNGQNVPTGNLPMGGFRHINVGAPTSVNNYFRVREFIENVPIFMNDAESSADRISVSAQYFTSVSANQAPGDGTRIIVRANSNKSSAVLYLNGHSANVEFQDGNRAVAAMVSGGIYEFLYSSVDTAWKIQNADDGRTAAEIAAGVTPTNYQYEPGDVRRYGAVGDDTTDDTTALINAGKSSLEVYIPPNFICRVTGALAAGIQSGQRWHGGGKITTANGFDFTVFSVSGKTDVTFDGIVAESGTLGAAYSAATARFVEFVSSSDRGRMLNCKVTGFQQAARVHTAEHCQIVGNDIINPIGWGISVQTDAHDCVVAHNRISGCVNEHNIYVSGSSGDRIRSPHIHNNTVTDAAIDGIKVTHCDDLHIHDNTSYANAGEGIYLTIGINRANVHDNHSYSNSGNGILVFTSTASDTMDRNHIHHNTVYLNQSDGIRVQVGNASATISNTIVGDNIVDDNNQSAGSFRGISLSVSSGTNSGTQVLRNFVTNETTAINIGSSVTGAILDGNRFAGNTTNISDSGTSTVIEQVTRGATSVADGGTITHGHPKTPTNARATASTSGEFVSVTALGATTITVAIKKHDNTAGTTQTVYWEVSG